MPLRPRALYAGHAQPLCTSCITRRATNAICDMALPSRMRAWQGWPPVGICGMRQYYSDLGAAGAGADWARKQHKGHGVDDEWKEAAELATCDAFGGLRRSDIKGQDSWWSLEWETHERQAQLQRAVAAHEPREARGCRDAGLVDDHVLRLAARRHVRERAVARERAHDDGLRR